MHDAFNSMRHVVSNDKMFSYEPSSCDSISFKMCHPLRGLQAKYSIRWGHPAQTCLKFEEYPYGYTD